MELQYVKTDKNGTKYYHDWTCARCGGEGRSSKWSYTGYTCYACNGTGKRAEPKVIKVYTPEYRAQLDQKAAEKQNAKMQKLYDEYGGKEAYEKHVQEQAEKALVRLLSDNGFGPDRIGYVYIGNTYSIKDRLKMIGGKYIYGQWVSPKAIYLSEEDNVVAVKIDATPYRNEAGGYDFWSAIFTAVREYKQQNNL